MEILTKQITITLKIILSLLLVATCTYGQQLKVNDLEYLEKQGVNVFVFSNEYNGMFFDEKTAGIELIRPEGLLDYKTRPSSGTWYLWSMTGKLTAIITASKWCFAMKNSILIRESL